ncbi:hypothetical protein ACQPU1_15995 [Clostridium paraputrificum]|uniref:hypothetical protein n=1 Tax=Clostridium TaxID=1485 RepID=UPI003D336B7E
MYRNFIILQEDEKTHAASGEKALSGYAKIEAKSDKCKISFYAQNLKKDDTYSIVLICYKKEMKQIVDLGSLVVNEMGKGESSKEYYVNNIAGLNFSYEKISGAAICKRRDGELIFLMYGFMNGENVNDGWKKCTIIKHDEKNEEVIEKEIKKIEKSVKKIEKETKEEVKKIEKKEDHDHKKCDHEDKCNKDDHDKHEDKCDVHDKHKDKCDDNDKNEDKCDGHDKHEEKCSYKKEDEDKNYKKDCMGMCPKRDELEIDFDEYETRIEEDKEIDPYDFEMRGALGDYFQGIVKDFDECRNKFKDIKYCKWYKVKVNNLDEMCNVSNYNKYTIAYYPMLNYYPYIKKYGYFMMGYKCDSKGDLKYIVYGVPGKKDKDEQPYAGKTGFVTWMNTDKDDMGCWLMFYDYKNSTIVVPMK